jgi:hypothetical protein
LSGLFAFVFFTPPPLWEYNFLFMPFLFMSTLSGMQLKCKTMAGHILLSVFWSCVWGVVGVTPLVSRNTSDYIELIN